MCVCVSSVCVCVCVVILCDLFCAASLYVSFLIFPQMPCISISSLLLSSTRSLVPSFTSKSLQAPLLQAVKQVQHQGQQHQDGCANEQVRGGQHVAELPILLLLLVLPAGQSLKCKNPTNEFANEACHVPKSP